MNNFLPEYPQNVFKFKGYKYVKVNRHAYFFFNSLNEPLAFLLINSLMFPEIELFFFFIFQQAHALLHFYKICIINCQDLQIIFPLLIKINIFILHIHQWSVYMFRVMPQHFLFHSPVKNRMIILDGCPISPRDRIACHFLVNSVYEHKSFLKA